MRLFNASIVDVADTFLHAGYVSAYPRALEAVAYPPGSEYFDSAEKVIELNMHEALELGKSAVDAGVSDASAAVMSSGGNTSLLIGALSVLGVLGLLYLWKRQGGIGAAAFRPAWAASTFAMVLLLLNPHCKDDKTLPTDPPWEGETVQSYAHPEEATYAILYGIIKPATAGIGQGVDVLANIQNETALPVKSLTEGEQYALKMYGLDGWGNPFALNWTEESYYEESNYRVYEVTSAGPDGTMNTDDDISASFRQITNDCWGDVTEVSFYIVPSGDTPTLLFHRWKNKMFEYNDKSVAEGLTGDVLFDVLDDLNETQIAAVDTSFNNLASDGGSDPLVLQVFQR